jgi:hypothetical protein
MSFTTSRPIECAEPITLRHRPYDPRASPPICGGTVRDSALRWGRKRKNSIAPLPSLSAFRPAILGGRVRNASTEKISAIKSRGEDRSGSKLFSFALLRLAANAWKIDIVAARGGASRKGGGGRGGGGGGNLLSTAGEVPQVGDGVSARPRPASAWRFQTPARRERDGYLFSFPKSSTEEICTPSSSSLCPSFSEHGAQDGSDAVERCPRKRR